MDGSKNDITGPEERKLIFSHTVRGYQNLIQLSIGDDSSLGIVVIADEPIDELLSKLGGGIWSFL